MFAKHSPRIGALNGNSDSTGCVRGGRDSHLKVQKLDSLPNGWFFCNLWTKGFQLSPRLPSP